MQQKSVLLNIILFAILAAFIEFGRRVSRRSDIFDAEKKVGKKGFTPLMYAAGAGEAETALAIIGAGVDVNAQDDRGGTALMFATNDRNNAMVKLLLDAGADSGLKTRKGLTALQIAKNHGDKDIAELLQHAAEARKA